MLPSDFADRDPAAERAQFYVALTRAEEFLIVVSSGDTPFLKELDRNIEVGLANNLQQAFKSGKALQISDLSDAL
jgi:hypothetical protein